MSRKAAAVSGRCAAEYGYDSLCFVDYLHNFGAVKKRFGSIVGLMAQALHFNKPTGELPEFHGKAGHSGLVTALVASVPVFQGAICLLPSRLVAAGSVSPNQQVGAAMGQRVKYRVVGRADSPPQFGLPWATQATANAAGRQMASDSEQIFRIH